jgi:phosphopantetheinyl transferase (holo-ACP synthase)
MAASLKHLTSLEVEKVKREKQLQESVSQLDAQVNSLNSKWSALEAFIKRWWPVAVGFVALISGLIGFTAWWINTVETKDNVVKVEQRLNKRIDSLKMMMK